MGPFEDCRRPFDIIVLKDTLKDFIIRKVEASIDNKKTFLASGYYY
jgi:hypothetical protein